MNQVQLLKRLLPGFIPLFIFIAADEIWGTKVGLIVAVATGLAELAIIGFREKRFDRFTLFDTLLIVILGLISILLENDIFFKLKPGIIELILLSMLGISGFSSVNLIGIMGQKYLKEIQISDVQLNLMKKNFRILFIVFLFHTVLVFYSAFYLSDKAWAFISGVLFYLLFGGVILFQVIRKRFLAGKSGHEEWLPMVDESGKITGQAPRSVFHSGTKMLHPVVHMHVIHPEGKLLLQKRSLDKLIQPGKWDTSVGGHIGIGETLDEALKRETSEEIGIKEFSAAFVKSYRWETEVEAELVYLFVCIDQVHGPFQSNEADELKFWSKREMEKNTGTGIFTESLEHEYLLLKQLKFI